MRFFLDLIYVILLLACAPWLIWTALTTGKYRRGWSAKLLGRVPKRRTAGRCIWLHAVSVGEVNLLETLIEPLSQQHPDWELVISTTTRTGYELAGKKYTGTCVFYCPLDFSWATQAAMRRVRPDLLVLAELELWPNLVAAARRSGARVAIVNGRLSEGSFRGYRRIRRLIAAVLRQVDVVAVQNEPYADRFRNLGARHKSVHITGSLKFDGAQTDRGRPQTRRLAELAKIAADDVVFLAGSTQRGEEALAAATYAELAPQFPQLRLIVVPRHPERFDEVAALLDQAKIPWQRRSELNAAEDAAPPRVLLVDTIGELGHWWATADIGFVGGSLGDRGGQNMIEPAGYGVAVSFGPNTNNFRDVVALLLERRAAEVVHDGNEMTAFVRRCLKRPDEAEAMGRRAQQLVVEQQGAARQTIALLENLLPDSSPAANRHAA